MRSKIAELIDTFASMDHEFRLEMLMDYAEKLPPLPERLKTAKQKETHRVHECQTPVSLWVEIEDGKVQIYADVPPESPTVRGFISLLMQAFNGAAPEDLLSAPSDILQRSGLAQTLGMTRMQGLSAVYRRVKDEVKQAGLSGATRDE
ncbi:MAG: SufE family protein [Aliifodinibius sp.]|nr:SufE family protein [Fodinibius sp.]NIX00555.1 SufE family protein [Phycisphaerae bacterium]NIY24432.1 SufE family protein [Fodinibius sp.]